ncbi:UDP-N-acetylmuramoyl-L-alanyl-D-glutamate--2,6-diaminopimelate ligase [Acidiferrimicrobium sp. IK]|uniref:UDP-N-acetylmuramoyl-L-alanyl-D-glutamate--2, 6-diaminopimelate ligase n=1 Tax=Acidiferrimicrobium sp. IK TaxID=2871700 RepID=UPI0021CB18E6|nr:UDP-N-acetylmuramoyl-L-alanyl-D-glutamate--2,6-diaminopimelate ligase [Acidiferrimicrobium sp. IK]MCU4183690.1 UDP-N-acetylmuramoyl-L-alanyl-D-glutamate--2,6-diaminopimelate ligase [Acidiferrimicrobium sp. IK]
MRLRSLLRDAGLHDASVLPGPTGDDPEISGVTMDSRSAGPGTLFACVPGASVDGHDYAATAVSLGATALVVERPLDVAATQLLVPSTRLALGPLSDAFFGHPSRQLRVTGVTGTNGKTTTVALLAGIFEAHGWATGRLGTLTQVRTTPEAPELQGRLAQMRDAGTDAVAMEVSSHALAQHRTDAIRFVAGVLTNVTQDHLDFHHTMEAYFEAKASLFAPGRVGVAVINRDDPWGRRLLDRLAGGPVEAVTFGADDATDVRMTPAGSRFRWAGQEVRLPLAGRFNIANALGAAACARALGIPPATIASGLGAVVGVPGRFQAVDAGQAFSVIVDYAHTPDGLAVALDAAREVTAGRLIVVFGAGGDRDRDKRPLMGQVVAERADLAIVTSDNPRHEDPQSIIDQVLAGAGATRGRLTDDRDRRSAISSAIALAEPGDVVVIAGKGHETGQDFGDRTEPFDDAAEARDALERVLRSRSGRGSGTAPS